jgi:trigger factor
LKLADYLSFLKVSEADFRKNYQAQAEKNVKNQLIIAQIIDQEKIEASEEELDEKIAAQAASVEKDAAEYKKTMDPRQIEYIKNDILVTKLFDFLKANNEMYVEESK